MANRRLLPLWSVVLALFLYPRVSADSLDIETLIEEALDANPSLQAMEHRIAALEARIPQAGALPDPMLSVGFSNIPLGGFDFDSTPMTSKNLGITQSVFLPGLRSARTSIAEFAVEETRERLKERRAEIVYRLRETYYDLAFLDRVVLLLRENQRMLDEVAEIADIYYSTGKGPQAAMLRARIARGMLEDRILTLIASREAQAARLNAILNRDVDEPVDGALPPSGHLVVPSYEELEHTAFESRGLLKAIEQASLKWDAASAAARKESWPFLRFHAQYNQRAAVPGDPVAGDDFLTAHVAFSIPIFKGRKQSQKALEASEKRFAQERQLEWEKTNIRRAIREVTARIRQHNRQHVLFKDQILPQSHVALASAVAAYRVGKADMDDVLEAQTNLLKAEVMEFHHFILHVKFEAKLERVIGSRLPRSASSSPSNRGGGGH